MKPIEPIQIGWESETGISTVETIITIIIVLLCYNQNVPFN